MPIHTDREIAAQCPGIVVKNIPDKKCTLIHVAIASDKNNYSIKVLETLSNYKDLETDIARMWQMKIQTILVVLGALGVIKQRFREAHQ